MSKLMKSLKFECRACAAEYASATRAGIQSSRPILRANASLAGLIE